MPTFGSLNLNRRTVLYHKLSSLGSRVCVNWKVDATNCVQVIIGVTITAQTVVL